MWVGVLKTTETHTHNILPKKKKKSQTNKAVIQRWSCTLWKKLFLLLAPFSV